MINRLKIFLSRFRFARWLANLKNGTLRLLRHGYRPRLFWDEWSERFSKQAYQRELHASNRWLLDKLREAKPDEVLEVGCGFGRNLKMLADELDHPCRLYGIDISMKLLGKVRSELGVEAGLLCGDITRLPLCDNAFDTVVTHGVLMHVPPEHIREAVRELVRVTGKTLWCIEEQLRTSSPRRESFSLNGYTFIHHYPTLFDELGIRIAEADYQGESVALILMRIDLDNAPTDRPGT